ncbi:ATP-binding cassette domain-containing protein [Risungbinella massiliensis]|uniref:ATP-binding cassette domain-containing protein n=1 Tax=Risungbinella massiliensis TaxID=1329796 RepID=UPI00069B0868
MVGSIIEYPGFYENLSLYENISLHLQYEKQTITDEKVMELLKLVNLDQQHYKLFSQTSLGMKQRLGLARALAHNPKNTFIR